jgi:hypothetical protein
MTIIGNDQMVDLMTTTLTTPYINTKGYFKIHLLRDGSFCDVLSKIVGSDEHRIYIKMNDCPGTVPKISLTKLCVCRDTIAGHTDCHQDNVGCCNQHNGASFKISHCNPYLYIKLLKHLFDEASRLQSDQENKDCIKNDFKTVCDQIITQYKLPLSVKLSSDFENMFYSHVIGFDDYFTNFDLFLLKSAFIKQIGCMSMIICDNLDTSKSYDQWVKLLLNDTQKNKQDNTEIEQKNGDLNENISGDNVSDDDIEDNSLTIHNLNILSQLNLEPDITWSTCILFCFSLIILYYVVAFITVINDIVEYIF